MIRVMLERTMLSVKEISIRCQCSVSDVMKILVKYKIERPGNKI